MNKLTLAWIFIAINLALFGPTLGLGLLMLPIMPLFLAGMSTDSGDTSLVAPILIVGYLIVIPWLYLLYRSIKLVWRQRRSGQPKE